MFRFTKKPSSGSHSQCLAKITRSGSEFFPNFPNLLWHENLHVSGSFSAHHQEFIHCTLGTGVCHTGLKTAFEQNQDVPSWSCSKTVWRVCCALCKCIPLHSAQHTRHTGHTMPPYH